MIRVIGAFKKKEKKCETNEGIKEAGSKKRRGGSVSRTRRLQTSKWPFGAATWSGVLPKWLVTPSMESSDLTPLPSEDTSSAKHTHTHKLLCAPNLNKPTQTRSLHARK